MSKYLVDASCEQKRLKIVWEVKEAQREYKKGLAKRGTVEDLIKDLEADENCRDLKFEITLA